MNSTIVFITFLGICISCSSPDKALQNLTDTTTSGTSHISSTLLQSKSTNHKGIVISDFILDTLSLQSTKGINTAFTITIDEACIKDIRKKGYDGLLVDLTCNGKSGKTFCYRNSCLPNLSTCHVHPNKHSFFNTSDTRALSIHIPFREMELPEGTHPITVSINVYPITFKQDTVQRETKYISRISSDAISETTYEAIIKAPKLYHAAVKMSDLTINVKNKDPHKYDFAFGGNGYPDPYWQLWCGETLVYYSPVLKNTLRFPGPYTSSEFYVSKDDILSLRFLDYDNGPFNKDDEIERWNGTLNALNHQSNLIQGNVSKCLIEVHHIEDH